MQISKTDGIAGKIIWCLLLLTSNENSRGVVGIQELLSRHQQKHT